MRITKPLVPLHATRTPANSLTSVRLNQVAGATRQDRRTRRRLRELCDEVLASFRVANGRDLFSDEDRRAADQLLPGRFRRSLG
jgi:hypothetical protein